MKYSSKTNCIGSIHLMTVDIPLAQGRDKIKIKLQSISNNCIINKLLSIKIF